MSTSRNEQMDSDIPSIICIYDSTQKVTYKKGKFYGKGTFGKCYKLIRVPDGKNFAGKILSKKLMVTDNRKEKMMQEIAIHRSLKHQNVVEFFNSFEDSNNVYIILELCKKRSMMELLKRRKVLTPPEVRYYIQQILSGVDYLHSNKIIHRDLKLGNLFLNKELQVKIGDFGLATKIEHDGEQRKHLCGTPNYIAPEILSRKGYSFEVDIWSIGCIMYALFIGQPPFVSNTRKKTYSKIMKCDYKIPHAISADAQQMISLMLQLDPKSRPTACKLIEHKFMHGYCPPSLPASCLIMAPRLDQLEKNVPRKPLAEIENAENIPSTSKDHVNDNSIIARGRTASAQQTHMIPFDGKDNFITLRNMLYSVLTTKPAHSNITFSNEMSDPSAQPMIWISKWTDYSKKYGFSYQLSDQSVGVFFNDSTKLIMLPNGINVHYINKTGEESYMTVDTYPEMLEKKMKLLLHFVQYMRNLMETGPSVKRESDSLSRPPHLHQWIRSTCSVLMQLNNGTVQVNFGDHTKIIMCPLMAAVTYIDSEKSFTTFKFTTIEKNGCCSDLYERLCYAYDKIIKLLSENTN